MSKPIVLAIASTAVCALVACSGSAPSTIELDQRTGVRIGSSGVSMAVQIDQAGFYTLFTEGEEDTVCSITDVTGREIAEDDDSGEGLNCLINTRLEAGRYTVHVRGYDFSDRGHTDVTLSRIASRPVELGQVVDVNVSGLQGELLEFDLARAGHYRITTSGRIDTVCWLFDAQGKELHFNDDYGNDQNCGMLLPLQPGRHGVLVRGYDASSGTTAFLAAPARVRSLELTMGEPTPDRLEVTDDLVDFELRVDQPGMYILFTSGDTDTYCELRDQTGSLLAENDDGEDQNCRIQHALRAGQYYFTVRGYGGATGDYVAHLNRR